ncbi:thymidylate synthase [Actinoallomurus iriomotensis]|uniref:Thymidylate synthase n=1 Tax=Actinoallomurus iriomotensis TaxID=478107 RepID=A0A9W6RS43_9ACTN|nr:thymidylate synthase [Actinoallomurus iriomotensis]GLY80564.1 thymidylate synthase [Actinoallomurus iriomotensis]
MHPPRFPAFTDAYRAVLHQLHTGAEYTTASRGNHSRECLNMAFTLTDPRRRTPYLKARRPNIVFNYAEALWYLSGRDDLAMIGYYAPRLRSLSRDGLRLTGTAYGPRLFRFPGTDRPSQWGQIVDLLRHDPDSKRAVITVMRPDELTDPANPDVACTLSLQFLLRDGRLHLVVGMRGNDAMIGLVCDVFSFTLIQEFTAVQLGAQLGTYTHQVASMHVNEPDLARMDEILAEPALNDPFPGSPMPADTSWDTIRHVLRWESELRTNRRRFDPEARPPAPASLYWRQILLLFEVYRQIIHQPGEPIEAATLDALTPAHRWLVTQRWPTRAGAEPTESTIR